MERKRERGGECANNVKARARINGSTEIFTRILLY